jgi:hypothetical protein
VAEIEVVRAIGAREWEFGPGELNKEELEQFGKILDERPASLRGRTVGMMLAESGRDAEW